LWTVHLVPFYALFVYSGPPRSHDDLGPTARWFVVVYVVSVLIFHFPGLWGHCPSFSQRLLGAGVVAHQYDCTTIGLSDDACPHSHGTGCKLVQWAAATHTHAAIIIM
jgi:hypothetical protein